MNVYKIGDLTKLFEKDEVSQKIPTSNSTDLQNEELLFGAGGRLKNNKLEKNVSSGNDLSSEKGRRFKAKREEDKGKFLKQDKLLLIPQPLDKDTGTKIKGKTVKKVENLPSLSSSKVHTAGFDPPPGILHESILKKGRKRELDDEVKAVKRDKPMKKTKTLDSVDKFKKTRRNVPSHTEEEDKRTIFIGNLSLEVTEKDLKKIFREFGEIESIRRRCVPVKDPDQRKRVAAIKGELHPERHNSVCYIKFKTEDAARKALVNNGKLVQNLHIRVDRASGSSMRDTKRTVFVANLPFDVEEEPLRGHFEDCGDIDYVRIVRDKRTCVGKGIGYVKFVDPASMFLALKLNESSFQGRPLRVQRCRYSSGGGKSRSDIKTKPVNSKNKTRLLSGNRSKTEQKTSKFQGKKSKKLPRRRKQSNTKSTSSIFFAAKKVATMKNTPRQHLGSSSFIVSNKSEGKHIIFD